MRPKKLRLKQALLTLSVWSLVAGEAISIPPRFNPTPSKTVPPPVPWTQTRTREERLAVLKNQSQAKKESLDKDTKERKTVEGDQKKGFAEGRKKGQGDAFALAPTQISGFSANYQKAYREGLTQGKLDKEQKTPQENKK